MNIIIVSKNHVFIDFISALKSINETKNFVYFSEYEAALEQSTDNDLLIVDIEVFNSSNITIKYKISVYQALCIEKNQLTNIKQFLTLPIDAIIIVSDDKQLLENLIKSAKANRKYYSNEILNLIINDFQKTESESNQREDIFTKKELEILYFICKGLTNNEISQKLNLATNTIKSHKKNIFKKTKVKSTPELIVLALKNNWTVENG